MQLKARAPPNGVWLSYGSQFPLWDFFECNTAKLLRRLTEIVGSDSQFPFWDFVECNAVVIGFTSEWLPVIQIYSQFPFWDFFECNFDKKLYDWTPEKARSQFPLWDFFECNM